jgi:hypothetical protein
LGLVYILVYWLSGVNAVGQLDFDYGPHPVPDFSYSSLYRTVYCIAVLPFRHFTVLLSYHIAVLQHSRFVVLLFYRIIVVCRISARSLSSEFPFVFQSRFALGSRSSSALSILRPSVMLLCVNSIQSYLSPMSLLSRSVIGFFILDMTCMRL